MKLVKIDCAPEQHYNGINSTLESDECNEIPHLCTVHNEAGFQIALVNARPNPDVLALTTSNAWSQLNAALAAWSHQIALDSTSLCETTGKPGTRDARTVTTSRAGHTHSDG